MRSKTHLLNFFINAWKSTLYKNGFYLSLNNLATSFLGFIFWNIMARYFPPSQVGIGTALVAASSLVAIITNLGLGVGLIRFLPSNIGKAEKLINSTLTLSGLLALITSTLYLVCISRLSPALQFVQDNYWLSICFVIFTVATSLSIQTDNSLIAGRASSYVLHKNVLISILKIFMVVTVFKSFSGFGIFSGTGTGILIGTLLAWLVFLPRVYNGFYVRPRLAKHLILQLLPYSFANYLASLLTQAPGFIFPLMVLNVLGPEESAYFWIAWMMTMVLAVIPSGISQSLLAESSHDVKRLGIDGRRILVIVLCLMIPAVGVMLLFGNWLLHFFGKGYAEHGTIVMRYLVLGIIPQSINILFITVNQVKKRIYLIVAQTSFMAFVSIGMGYWLLSIFGLKGIGMGYTIAQFLVAIVVLGPLIQSLKENSISIKES